MPICFCFSFFFISLILHLSICLFVFLPVCRFLSFSFSLSLILGSLECVVFKISFAIYILTHFFLPIAIFHYQLVCISPPFSISLSLSLSLAPPLSLSGLSYLPVLPSFSSVCRHLSATIGIPMKLIYT